MNDALRMKDIAGFSADVSLFTTIQTNGGLWADIDATDLQTLAEEYYVHSSNKLLSPICRKWVNDAVDLTAFINKIAGALIMRFGKNWTDIWNAYFVAQYNPLENYSMEEKETPYLIDATTINTETDLTNTQKNKVYGFNSASPVGDSESEVTTKGDKTKNETKSTTSHTGNRTLVRAGNIGVTTSQQMLQSELDLRRLDYWEMVFKDIDRLLCRTIWTC